MSVSKVVEGGSEMKQYEIQTVLSGGSRLYNPLNAKSIEAVKKIAAEKRAPMTHPGETVIAVEIYEKVKVGAVRVKPRVVVGEDGLCKVCHRLHKPDQPCPLRIANAYTMQMRALQELTEADTKWMREHSNFSVLDVVEDAIVEAMPLYPVPM